MYHAMVVQELQSPAMQKEWPAANGFRNLLP
jgi:hypothetical protein